MLAGAPAGGAEPTPTTPMLEAFSAAAGELQRLAGDPKLRLDRRLDKLAGFEFSAGTREKLVKLFGTSELASLERIPSPKGQQGYRFTIHPLSYAGAGASTVAWTELTVDASVDKSGHNVVAHGLWPSLAVGSKDVRLAMSGMSFDSKQQQGVADMWLGKMQMNIANIKLDGVARPFSVAIDEVAVKAETVTHGKLIDLAYDTTIKRISVGGEQVDEVRMVTRVTKLDAAAVVALQRASAKNGSGQLTPARQMEAITPLFKTLGKSMAAHGSAIEIDEISARYHGHSANIKGRITFGAMLEKDFDSLAALTRKIIAHFELRVPLALVQEVVRTFMRKQMEARPGAVITDEALNQATQSTTDIVLGKLLGGAYARMDNGVLMSSIDVLDNKLTVNGKEINLPKPVPSAAKPGAPPLVSQRLGAQSLAASNMPARAVLERCARGLPPPEAQRQKARLHAKTRFMVGGDGKVREVQLTESSNWPEYDKNVLAATAACTWIPALVNGKPADSKVEETHDVNWDDIAPVNK